MPSPFRTGPSDDAAALEASGPSRSLNLGEVRTRIRTRSKFVNREPESGPRWNPCGIQHPFNGTAIRLLSRRRPPRNGSPSRRPLANPDSGLPVLIRTGFPFSAPRYEDPGTPNRYLGIAESEDPNSRIRRLGAAPSRANFLAASTPWDQWHSGRPGPALQEKNEAGGDAPFRCKGVSGVVHESETHVPRTCHGKFTWISTDCENRQFDQMHLLDLASWLSVALGDSNSFSAF